MLCFHRIVDLGVWLFWAPQEAWLSLTLWVSVVLHLYSIRDFFFHTVLWLFSKMTLENLSSYNVVRQLCLKAFSFLVPMNNSKPKPLLWRRLLFQRGNSSSGFRKSVRNLVVTCPPHPSKSVLRSQNSMKKYPSWKVIWNISVHKKVFEFVIFDFSVKFPDGCRLSSHSTQILGHCTEEIDVPL